jgi:segregation and condensation protein B
MMDSDLIRRIVEAGLLAAPQPMSVAALQALFPDDAPPEPGSIEQALMALAEENGRRGVRLIEVASGWRFQVDSELQPWISRLWTERPARYSRALLETLALIAYRQPITRGEIEQIRGVAVSSHIIKTLEEREWIRVVGHRDVPGRPALFGTTRGFLDYFGLKTLDELPPLTELQDLPELEPELPLEPVAMAPALVDEAAHDAAADTGASEPDDDVDAASAAGAADTQLAGAVDAVREDDSNGAGYETEIVAGEAAGEAVDADADGVTDTDAVAGIGTDAESDAVADADADTAKKHPTPTRNPQPVRNPNSNPKPNPNPLRQP